ncbi:MAG: DUF1850 domain-containing protein [Tissierellia bacterium]|nr:DUF1850 domain-containing protein [Tissierellia bacterium]
MKRYNEGVRRIPPSSYFLVLIAIVFAIVLFPVKFIVAKDMQGNILFCKKISEGESIIIEYTHSVEKTTVSEYFKAGKDSLILMEERFSSFGAGLPADKIYPFKIVGDQYVLYDINKEMKEVTFRTGAVIANHRIIIDNHITAFTDFSKPRQAVTFSIENIRIYKYIMGGVGFE